MNRGLHSVALVLLYVFGLCVAAAGAAVLQTRQGTVDRAGDFD